MFGTFRTILALMVLVSHICAVYPIGLYAVFGFYMLSGLLMTTVIKERYGYSNKGRIKYIANRFLRIYPSYWFAAAISLALITWIGRDAIAPFHGAIYTPTTLGEVVKNLFLLFSWQSSPRLVPPAWALTLELFFYVVICLGASKTYKRTILWLLASISYTCAAIIFSDRFPPRYYYIPAASLPFALGSYLYYLDKRSIVAWLSRIKLSPAILTVLMGFNYLIHDAFQKIFGGQAVLMSGFYINLLIIILIIISLSSGGRYPWVKKAHDKFIGDFSYPLYLTHWQAGIIASVIIFGEPYRGNTLEGVAVLAGTITISVVLSFLMIKFLEQPIESIRSKVRGRAVMRDYQEDLPTTSLK